MESTTLEQLEKMREDARALESQSKSLPVLLSVTFIPILFACGFVVFPEDSKGILLLGKLWVAGIIVGLMACSYLSAALAQATNFRKYWPSLLCGLIVAVPPTLATISHAKYGLTLVQWSVTLGLISCGVGLYLYLKKTGENKTKFTVHFIHSFVALLVLYAQLRLGLTIAYNFSSLSTAGQVMLSALYPFITFVFRHLCLLFVPASGNFSSEMFSIYFASMTYRILTIYYANWGVFLLVLFLEIFFKFVFYSIQLSDKYLSFRKHVQASCKRMWHLLPTRFHQYTDLESDTEELLPVPLEAEKLTYHKEVSFLFFLQTHADTYIGLAFALVLLTLMKLVGTNSHDCFPAFFSTYMSLTWKFSVIAVVQIANLVLFYLFASKFLHKPNFTPVHEATTKVHQHHVKLLVTNVALFMLLYLLFFKSYAHTMSSYCPFVNN